MGVLSWVQWEPRVSWLLIIGNDAFESGIYSRSSDITLSPSLCIVRFVGRYVPRIKGSIRCLQQIVHKRDPTLKLTLTANPMSFLCGSSSDVIVVIATYMRLSESLSLLKIEISGHNCLAYSQSIEPRWWFFTWWELIYREKFTDEDFKLKHTSLRFLSMESASLDINGSRFLITSVTTTWLDGATWFFLERNHGLTHGIARWISWYYWVAIMYQEPVDSKRQAGKTRHW